MNVKQGQVNNGKSETLGLAYEILMFIFRSDGMHSQALENILQKNGNLITEVFASLAVKELCFGS